VDRAHDPGCDADHCRRVWDHQHPAGSDPTARWWCVLTVLQRIPWHPSPDGGPLGRHVEHDPLSRGYAHRAVEGAAALRSVEWPRRVEPYDQTLGNCTIQDARGRLSTAPYRHRYTSERAARAWYSEETAADEFPGQWPPDDTGSSGLAAAKLARDKGLITGWTSAFTLADALAMLAHGPLGFGSIWLDSMDSPDSSGIVHGSLNAVIRGGHQYECSGLILATEGQVSGSDLLTFYQSWGLWGFFRGTPGRFAMTVADFDDLRQQQGDVISYSAPVA